MNARPSNSFRVTPPSRKVGLALSGGSTWGIAHVGVLKALTEAGIPISMLAGTSAGSLVAACYAFGMPIDAMIDASKRMNWKKLSKFGYSRLGLRSNAPMEAFITDLLGDVSIEDAKVPLAIVAADIETHEKVVVRTGRLHEAVRASTAIPGLFTPVKRDGRMLVDGAIIENLPVPTVHDMGADYIIAVNLSSVAGYKRPKHVLGVLISSLLSLTYHHDRELARGADCLIEPDVSGYDPSRFNDADAILEAGYKAGKNAVPYIRDALGIRTSRSWFSRIRERFSGRKSAI